MARKGLLHSVTYDLTDMDDGNVFSLDTTAELTKKLQQMVRQGSILKLVGVDISAQQTGSPDPPGGRVTGQLLYMSPTKGRCDAWRKAFSAVQKARRLQGVAPNYQYDFRLGYDANQSYAAGGNNPIPNQAFFETTAQGASEDLFFKDGGGGTDQSIFAKWNAGVEVQTTTPDFAAGWVPYMTTSSDLDYVSNEARLLSTNPKGPQAATEVSSVIPFQTSFSSSSTLETSTNFMWRPIAGEYLPVMCGLFNLQVMEASGVEESIDLRVTFHFSGWYPILNKKRSSKRSKKGGKRSRRRS